jgi:hypothetical protein
VLVVVLGLYLSQAQQRMSRMIFSYLCDCARAITTRTEPLEDPWTLCLCSKIC